MGLPSERRGQRRAEDRRVGVGETLRGEVGVGGEAHADSKARCSVLDGSLPILAGRDRSAVAPLWLLSSSCWSRKGDRVRGREPIKP